MLVDWEMVEQVADSGGKVYYFDAGASTYTAGAGGASQNWFVGIFHFPVLYFVILNREEWIEKKGLNLAGIFAWELAALAPSDVSSNEKTPLLIYFRYGNKFQGDSFLFTIGIIFLLLLRRTVTLIRLLF